MILKDAFGIGTWSYHGDGERRFFGSDDLVEIVGHQCSGLEGEDLARDLRVRDGLHVIKTHYHPSTDDPGIFIVRDGRAAVISYWHFLHDFFDFGATVGTVINGDVFAGSWSDHYLAWQPKIRPHTLMLRYEEITINPTGAIDAISSFLGMPPRQAFKRDLADLRRMNGEFFRTGNNGRNIAELAGYEEMFDQRHGSVMRDLGYY